MSSGTCSSSDWFMSDGITVGSREPISTYTQNYVSYQRFLAFCVPGLFKRYLTRTAWLIWISYLVKGVILVWLKINSSAHAVF